MLIVCRSITIIITITIAFPASLQCCVVQRLRAGVDRVHHVGYVDSAYVFKACGE